MGLSTKKRTGGNYLKVADGGIAREWREKPKEEDIPFQDGSMERMELKERTITKGKNKGKTVYYVLFTEITGYLKTVSLKDTDYGEQLEIVIEDMGEVYNLQFGADTNYGTDFMGKAQNLDLSLAVQINPWKMDKQDWYELTGKSMNGDYKVGLSMKQDGEKIESVYGRKEDGKIELPKWIKKEKRGGKIEWDSSPAMDQMFDDFEEWIANNFNPGKDESDKSQPPEKKKTETKAKRKAPETAPKDDLPFD